MLGTWRRDTAFHVAAAAAFERALPQGLDTVGPPHVAWSFKTQSGKVAVVAQRLRPRDLGEGRIEFGLHRFIEMREALFAGPEPLWIVGRPGALVTGRPTMNGYVVGGLAGAGGAQRSSGFFQDGFPARELILLDDGPRVQIANTYRVDPAGRLVWSWKPPLTGSDGGSTGFSLKTPVSIAVRVRGRRMELGNDLARPRLLEADLGGGDTRVVRGFDDEEGCHEVTPIDAWRVRGVTPDGRSFVVQTLVDGETIRLFRFLDGPSPAFLGTIPGREQSALATRLPDGQGIVFASKRSRFHFRRGNGSWLAHPRNAALLPPDTTQIRYPSGTGEAVLRVPA